MDSDQDGTDQLIAIGKLLLLEAVQTGVVPVNWQRLGEIYPVGVSPRFSQLVNSAAVLGKADGRNSKGDSLPNALRTAQSAKRQQILESHLRELVARVLGTSPAKLDSQKPLTNLGLDSIMGVELSHWLKKDLGVEMPIMKLFGGANIAQMTAELLEQLIPANSTTATIIEQIFVPPTLNAVATLEVNKSYSAVTL